jgi:thioesterase domain-containing protein/peptidoglycan/xylan/chitin deacetylase (PgdA/CDA1 family)
MDNHAASLLCGTPDLPPDCVALTFDDGPGPRSAELARMLHDDDVPGTFFVLGESVERHGGALAAFREYGHAIGLHADQHRPFKSAEHAATELSRCAERVHEYLGETVWFRPPYGFGDWLVPGFAGPVGWHASGRDWDITYRKGQTVDACVDAIAQQLIERRGGIALLHDFVPATEFRPAGLTEADLDLRIIEITRLLIERLRAAGLSFAALPPAKERRNSASERSSTVQKDQFPAADLQSLRTFRSTAKASGGTLELVMPMRVGGDGPAVFFAHPMIGLSWAHLTLLPHIDPRYPLYGLQARGLRRPEPLPVSMTEMALDYADQIRMIQPHGPYQLFGWSLGGNIAFAVAEELESRGEEIGLLVILDSNLTALDRIPPSNEPWMIYNLILAQFGYVPALTPADAEPEARMLELIRQRPGLGLDEWPEQRIRALQRVIKNNVIVAGTHKPGRVRAPMLFVSATQNPPALAEKVAGWRSFNDGPIEVIELDCDHRHMLLPHMAAQIGIALSEQLERLSTPIV